MTAILLIYFWRSRNENMQYLACFDMSVRLHITARDTQEGFLLNLILGFCNRICEGILHFGDTWTATAGHI
jgi:hypothetical protein